MVSRIHRRRSWRELRTARQQEIRTMQEYMEQSLSLVRLLLDRGADPFVENNQGIAVYQLCLRLAPADQGHLLGIFLTRVLQKCSKKSGAGM